jgi:hypothetical protein
VESIKISKYWGLGAVFESKGNFFSPVTINSIEPFKLPFLGFFISGRFDEHERTVERISIKYIVFTFIDYNFKFNKLNKYLDLLIES